MKSKKGLKKCLVVISAVLILTGIVFLILCNKKTDWFKAVETDGALNIMESDENVTSNEGYFVYEIEDGSDFKIAGELFIAEGSVKLTCSLDGKLLFEEVYSKGNHTFESEPYLKQSGELSITYSPTDDVGGNYNFHVFTRKTLFQRWIDRMREYFL